MSILLPNPADWIPRLQAAAPELLLVGLWQDLDRAISTGLTLAPAAFIIPAMERADGNNRTTHGVSQLITATWSVLLGVRNLRDASGAAQLDVLLYLRETIMAALLDWDWRNTQIAYSGGRSARLEQGALWWVDDYIFNYHLRVV